MSSASSTSPVWFITGASSGIGLALARHVLAQGERVVAAARRIDRLTLELGAPSPQLLPLQLDVTESTQVRRALAAAEDGFGRLDVLVNNAGYGLTAMAEDVTKEQARALFETNLFAPLDLVRSALPLLRSRGGRIVNVSSVGGAHAFPSMGIYAASKAALELYSEALDQEVRGLGVPVIVVEPGPYATEFGGAGHQVVPASAPYADLQQRLASMISGTKFGDPADAARAIYTAVRAPEPPRRIVLGSIAAGMARSAFSERLAEIDRTEEFTRLADGVG